jgi:uncharacterized protein (UPF0332 family)
MITFIKNEKYIAKKIKQQLLIEITSKFIDAFNMLDTSARHLDAAERIYDGDLEGSYILIYDAARIAMTSILLLNGLRPTAHGGHVIVGEALRTMVSEEDAQIFKRFDRLRSRRNKIEYYSDPHFLLSLEMVLEDYAAARRIYEGALSHYQGTASIDPLPIEPFSQEGGS